MARSPFLIQPNLRNRRSTKKTRTAGPISIKIMTPSQAMRGLSVISRIVEIGPMRAHVPIPAPAGVVRSIKTVVANGPKSAETMIVGSHINGLRKIFLN